MPSIIVWFKYLPQWVIKQRPQLLSAVWFPLLHELLDLSIVSVTDCKACIPKVYSYILFYLQWYSLKAIFLFLIVLEFRFKFLKYICKLRYDLHKQINFLMQFLYSRLKSSPAYCRKLKFLSIWLIGFEFIFLQQITETFICISKSQKALYCHTRYFPCLQKGISLLMELWKACLMFICNIWWYRWLQFVINYNFVWLTLELRMKIPQTHRFNWTNYEIVA